MQICLPSTAPTQLGKLACLLKPATVLHFPSLGVGMHLLLIVSPNFHTGSLYNFTCSAIPHLIFVFLRIIEFFMRQQFIEGGCRHTEVIKEFITVNWVKPPPS
jgi:hypothetical protein